jgi:hypothetical protein
MLERLSIIRETPTVQYWMALGRREAFQELAITVVAKRSRKLGSSAKTLISTIKDDKRLEVFIEELYASRSHRRTEQLLKALAAEVQAGNSPSQDFESEVPEERTWNNFFGKLLFWR